MTIITVTVTGPGSCINIEVETIKRALENMGCTVSVKNDYPLVEGYIGNKKASLDEIMSDITEKKRRGTNVQIVADHLPWGG